MKEKIREAFIAERKTLSESEVRKKSLKIIKRLVRLPEFRKAKTMMCYVSFGNEVRTHELISELLAQGKRIAVPKTGCGKKTMYAAEIKKFGSGMQKGHFGILEPKKGRRIKKEKLDLVIVPGVAFDRKGGRIGFGKGHFDRFLAGLKNGAPFVALAFDFQVRESPLPLDEKDVRVDKVVTEKCVLDANA